MTPKDKAKELIEKFECYADYQEDDCFNEIEKILINAKNIALICVDEIIKDRERLSDAFFYYGNFWQEVKEEIQKI